MKLEVPVIGILRGPDAALHSVPVIAGARAVGARTSLFGRKALMDQNLKEIADNVNTFITLCLDWKNKL